MYTVYAFRALGAPEYRYVGVTTRDLNRRVKEHLNYSEKYEYPMYRWLRQHKLTFVVDILAEVPDLPALFYMERMFIASLRASGNRLLNITEGGEGGSGRAQSPEARRKISEKLSGVKHTAERRKNLSDAARGRVYTPEGREKRRVQNTGSKNNFYGKSHSVESKEASSRTQHEQNHVAVSRVELLCFWCRVTVEAKEQRSMTSDEIKQGTTRELYYTTKSRHKIRHTAPVRICYFCTGS